MRETQKFLNYLNNANLVEDGIIGNKSREQIIIALQRLRAEFAKRLWKWEDFNFIGIRTDNDFDDTFEDWFVLTVYDTLIAVPCSTVAGVTSVWKYMNLWVNGKTGVGTIKSNQQIDYLLVEPDDKELIKKFGSWWTNWTGDIARGVKGKGFLYQDTPIDIRRGAIQDGGKWLIDMTSLIPNSVGNGMNVHTWVNFWGWIVGNLSEGCQVTREEYWNIIFPILVKNARLVNGQKRIT
ncbi:MAG: hypothetical protein ACRCXN_12305, partial [Bacteroidales bacterium]